MVAWGALSVVGCGRVGFDLLGGATAGSDANGMADSALVDAPAMASQVTPLGTAMANTNMVMLPNVTLAPGTWLLVVTSDHNADIGTMTWNGNTVTEEMSMGTWGNGPTYSSVWAYYSATGGSGPLIGYSTGVQDVVMLASAVSGLDPAGMDQQSMGFGAGTTASTGTTPPTADSNELVYVAALGDQGGAALGGTWSSGYTAGQSAFGPSGSIVEGWQTVTTTGGYTASLSGIPSQNWGAAILTYLQATTSYTWVPTSSQTGPFATPLSVTAGAACTVQGSTTSCSAPAGGGLFWHYATCSCQ